MKEWFVKTLDIRQQKTVIPEIWETNKVSSKIAPAYCQERVFRPQDRAITQAEPTRFQVKEIELGIREAKHIKSLQGKESERRELHRKRSLSHLQLSTD